VLRILSVKKYLREDAKKEERGGAQGPPKLPHLEPLLVEVRVCGREKGDRERKNVSTSERPGRPKTEPQQRDQQGGAGASLPIGFLVAPAGAAAGAISSVPASSVRGEMAGRCEAGERLLFARGGFCSGEPLVLAPRAPPPTPPPPPPKKSSPPPLVSAAANRAAGRAAAPIYSRGT
jgi:hypothetical protein